MKATVKKLLLKMVIVMVRDNEFSAQLIPVYIPNNNYKIDQEISIPLELKIVDWVGHFTKDNIQLKTIGR